MPIAISHSSFVLEWLIVVVQIQESLDSNLSSAQTFVSSKGSKSNSIYLILALIYDIL